jgi:hypothetical protein
LEVAETLVGAFGLVATTTTSGSAVIATVIVPSCVAVPRRVDALLTIAYATAPFLMVAFEMVTEIGFSGSVSGTVSLPVSQEIAIETM